MKIGTWMVPMAVLTFVGTFVSSMYLPFTPKVDYGYETRIYNNQEAVIPDQITATSKFYKVNIPISTVTVSNLPAKVIFDDSFSGIELSGADTALLSCASVGIMKFNVNQDAAVYIMADPPQMVYPDTMYKITDPALSVAFQRQIELEHDGQMKQFNDKLVELSKTPFVIRIGIKSNQRRCILSVNQCRQVETTRPFQFKELQLSLDNVELANIQMDVDNLMLNAYQNPPEDSAVWRKNPNSKSMIRLEGQVDRASLTNINQTNLEAHNLYIRECYLSHAELSDIKMNVSYLFNARFLHDTQLQVDGNPTYQRIREY